MGDVVYRLWVGRWVMGGGGYGSVGDGGGLCMCDGGALLVGDVVYRLWVGRWVMGGLMGG